MPVRAVRRLLIARSFKALCNKLVSRYGRPRWYTAGQVKTAARLCGKAKIADFALCVLTERDGRERKLVREQFSRQFLDGMLRFDARDITDRFAPKPFHGDGNWPNRFVYLGGPRF